MKNFEAFTKELEEFESMYATCIRLAEIGIWVWNLETGYISWDEQQCKIYGVVNESWDHTFDGFNKFLHPDDIPRIQREVNDTIENGQIFDTHFRIKNTVDKSGWALVKARGVVIRDKRSQKPLKFIGMNMMVPNCSI